MKHEAEYVGELFASGNGVRYQKTPFERKRNANKIIKRAISDLIEVGYDFGANGSVPKIDGKSEVLGLFGDIHSTHLGVIFKSIMDMDRRRHPNKDHILFERTMLTIYVCDAVPREYNPSYFFSESGHLQRATPIDRIKFKGVNPRKRLAKLHALGVAKLLE